MPKIKNLPAATRGALKHERPANGANPEQRFTRRGEEIGALKLKASAAYLGGLSVPTMHRLIARGLLRPCRQVRHLIFARTELDRFLREGMK